KPPSATPPPPRETPRLPLAIVGSLRHPEASHTILVLETPEGQRVVGEGDRVVDGVTLEAITADGAILDHQGRKERLPWPEAPPPPLMFDTE
ncbi:type II secretion system protein N, partial [Halomonas sp.]|uniref:type II secretion system protein N n=1 Tax=Halomonas sp. TaxID=1486246 RepID=UPI00298E1B49